MNVRPGSNAVLAVSDPRLDKAGLPGSRLRYRSCWRTESLGLVEDGSERGSVGSMLYLDC